MKILSLDIASFGKFKNYQLDLPDNMTVVFGENENIVKALEYSKKLRADGTYCENSAFETLEETKAYAKSKGIKKIWVVTEDGVREETV